MATTGISRRRLLGGAAASVGAVVPAWAGTAHADRGGAARAADLVLYGGQVLTMDRGRSVAEAVAVRDGRVIQVSDDRSVRRLIGRRTEVVNLRGRTALPGINDSHLHGLRTGLSLPPYNLDLGESAVRSIADVAAVVGEAVGQVAPGAWIRGKGWDETKLVEGRAPHRADLDGVAPDNPVALLDWSNHQLWVNSRALEIAGVTAETPSPEQADAIERAITLLLSQGITSYTEPGIGEVAQRLYADKARRGALRVRVTALLSRANDTFPVSTHEVREILATASPADKADPRWFAVTGVKLRADGVPIGSRTASYTTTPAWQDHADRWKGSLARGMAADVCIVDGRLLDGHGRLAMDPHDLSQLPVEMTIVDGLVAYDASDTSSPAAGALPAALARDAQPGQVCAHC